MKLITINGTLKFKTTGITYNFKNFTIYPLTIFIGPNASGKSLLVKFLTSIFQRDLEIRGIVCNMYSLYEIEGNIKITIDGIERIINKPSEQRIEQILTYLIDETRLVLKLQDITSGDISLKTFNKVINVLKEVESKVPLAIPATLRFSLTELLNELNLSLIIYDKLVKNVGIDSPTWRSILGEVYDYLKNKFLKYNISINELFNVELGFDKWFLLHDGYDIFSSNNFLLAPSGIFFSMLINSMIAAYIRSKDSHVMLIIEEPELHLHPIQAVSIGLTASHLVDKAISEGKDLNIIFTTHSVDVLNGSLATQNVEVYIFQRHKLNVDIIPWDGSSRIPGFTEAILCSLDNRSPGIEAIRNRRKSL